MQERFTRLIYLGFLEIDELEGYFAINKPMKIDQPICVELNGIFMGIPGLIEASHIKESSHIRSSSHEIFV